MVIDQTAPQAPFVLCLPKLPYSASGLRASKSGIRYKLGACRQAGCAKHNFFIYSLSSRATTRDPPFSLFVAYKAEFDSKGAASFFNSVHGIISVYMKRGKFIVFDGLDGSGKTTQAKLLCNYLFDQSKSNSVFLTREPYSDEFYEKIRQALKIGKNPTHRAKLFLDLFVSDRKLHVRDVEYLLSKGVHVISDRYKHSTLAYQNAQGIPLVDLMAVHKGMLVPDLTLLVDLPVKTVISRMGKDSQRKVTEVFEQRAFMEQLRKNYLALPKHLPKERIVVISGSGSVEKVFGLVRKQVDMVFS